MSVKKKENIKSISTRISKLKGKLPSLKDEMKDAQREHQECLKKISDLQFQLQKAEDDQRELEVSEHAIIRYLERVMQIDVDNIRNTIIGEVGKAHTAMGSGHYPIGNGCRAVIKNKTVVTIT